MLRPRKLLAPGRSAHFWRTLMVAHESGLSHPVVALDRRARRIVSEDSAHSITSLSAAVHPFSESKNAGVICVAQTPSSKKHDNASPRPVVICLLSDDRKPIEERQDALRDI